MADTNIYDYTSPGGQFADLVGGKVAGATIAPSKMVHHVNNTTEISTITPPHEGFCGPIYLVADSVFTTTTSGNLGATVSTTVVVGHAYGFIYDRKTAKWYPIGV